MKSKDILIASFGFIGGFAVATTIFYFEVYKKYIPLRQIEREISELEYRKWELDKQLNGDDKLQKLTDIAKEDANDSFDNTPYLPVVEYNVSEIIDEDQSDELDDDPVDIDANEPDRTNIVIHDGNPRWDGILTDDEQRQYDEANGDVELEESILQTIKARRWHESMNKEYPAYHISEEDHDEAPWFIDTVNLEYWAEDDILANGLEIIYNPEEIIDPIVLNRFGPNSLSGDNDIVWCRNDALDTDYQIIKHDGSFQNEVLGIPNL